MAYKGLDVVERAGGVSKDRNGASAPVDDQIYEAIQHAVLTQQLPPGTRLPEVTLSEVFNVSRSLVRKALTRLAADQIIVMRRNQTARVIKPSQEETREIFDARRFIEAEVMRQAAGRLQGKAAKDLLQIVDEEQSSQELNDQDRRIHLSIRFHEHIADFCPNRILVRVLHELILRTSVAIALYKVHGMSACYRGGDHRGIADALLRGKGDEAARLAVDHLDYLERQLALGEVERKVNLARILKRKRRG